MQQPVRVETKHLPWVSLRTGVDSADTLPAATTSKGVNIPSHVYRLAEGMNTIELRFLADADSRECTAYVYASRDGAGNGTDDICLVCSIAVTSGQLVSTGNKYYADTLVVTSLWFADKEPKTADAGGANRIARVAIDMVGYNKVFVLFNPVTSGTWEVELTGF